MNGIFYIDKLEEVKNGLRFNLLYQADDDTKEPEYVCIIGFRVANGIISPPSYPAKGRWHSPIIFGKRFAERLYETVGAAIAGRPSLNYKLAALNTAISELFDDAKLLRNYPSLGLDSVEKHGDENTTE